MKSFTRRTPIIDSGPDLAEIKTRFKNQNRQRLRRAYADLKQSENEFLELLPLLMHVNHPILPGYVDKETPAGLPEYNPAAPSLQVAKRLFKSFTYKKRAYRRFHIHSLFMMGSTGTIAYSNKSDFDIWVVHESDIEKDQLLQLQQKAEGIEQWARARGVEANLFLVNPKGFREGQNNSLSSESSGSAQHYLLLEEFYRTSILLAGRYPLWWLVPPEQEANYDNYAAQIKHKRLVHAREYVDLGGLNRIKADEFYGATLWLLYKSIHSPYKSILKILLMEAYATEYPKINLLGSRFKQVIYDGEEDINQIDPYLMMLHKVEEFLTRGGDAARLELARRSFYLKVDQKLSLSRSDNWRTGLMQELVDNWGWHHSQLVKLDNREAWKIKAVLDERKLLIREFTNTYRYLSLFARTKSDSNAIRAADLNILGRKLYAAFERKAGKIDIIYKGITPDLLETHVSFHELYSKQGQPYWMVFSGVVSPDDISLYTPLKRGYSLIELLAWCYFNKIINGRTILSLYGQNSDLSEKELQLIIERICKSFPEDILDVQTIEDMRQAARIMAVTSFVNVGLDPFSERTRRGEHLTSSRTDALKYGGRLENLALSIDQILITSWQEVLTFRYQGVEGLMQCIQDYLKWALPSSGKSPPAINASCYSSYRGTSIARRIESLFTEITNIFYKSGYAEGTRFVLGVEWQYVVMWMKNDVLYYNSPGEYEGFVDYLGKPQEKFHHYVFDSETLTDHVLPLVYKLNQAGKVQCFYEVKGELVFIYILDEKGALSVQEKPFHDVVGLVKQYEEFFASIRERAAFFNQSGQGSGAGFDETLFYRIDRDTGGKRSIRQHSLNRYVKPGQFVRLQVIVERVDEKDVMTLFCEEQEFSSLEYADKVFNVVARAILAMRRNHEAYPIHVTDIDLSPAILASGPQQTQTSQYLYYKKRIEKRLLEELMKIQDTR